MTDQVSDKTFHGAATEKANFQNQAVPLLAWVWLNWQKQPMNIQMGETTGPPPTGRNNGNRPHEDKNEQPSTGRAKQPLVQPVQQQEKNETSDLNNEKENIPATPEESKNATSSTCKRIATERPKIDLPSHRINA